MYSDKLSESVRDAASPVRTETMARLAVRESAATRDNRDRAFDAYDTAHAEYLESVGAITGATSDRNATTAAALAGLAILSVAGTTLPWVLALLVTVACGALAVRRQLQLIEAREQCQTAIQKMYLEYRVAKERGNADSIPERPALTCP